MFSAKSAISDPFLLRAEIVLSWQTASGKNYPFPLKRTPLGFVFGASF